MQKLYVGAENIFVQSGSSGLLYVDGREERTQLPDAYHSLECSSHMPPAPLLLYRRSTSQGSTVHVS